MKNAHNQFVLVSYQSILSRIYDGTARAYFIAVTKNHTGSRWSDPTKERLWKCGRAQVPRIHQAAAPEQRVRSPHALQHKSHADLSLVQFKQTCATSQPPSRSSSLKEPDVGMKRVFSWTLCCLHLIQQEHCFPSDSLTKKTKRIGPRSTSDAQEFTCGQVGFEGQTFFGVSTQDKTLSRRDCKHVRAQQISLFVQSWYTVFQCCAQPAQRQRPDCSFKFSPKRYEILSVLWQSDLGRNRGQPSPSPDLRQDKSYLGLKFLAGQGRFSICAFHGSVEHPLNIQSLNRRGFLWEWSWFEGSGNKFCTSVFLVKYPILIVYIFGSNFFPSNHHKGPEPVAFRVARISRFVGKTSAWSLKTAKKRQGSHCGWPTKFHDFSMIFPGFQSFFQVFFGYFVDFVYPFSKINEVKTSIFLLEKTFGKNQKFFKWIYKLMFLFLHKIWKVTIYFWIVTYFGKVLF